MRFSDFRPPAASVLALSCAVLSGGNAAAESTEFHLLSDHDLEVPITSVTINDVQTSAVLDTGSTIVVVHNELIAGQSQESNLQEATRVLGLGGETFFPIREIETISTGSVEFANLSAAVHTESEFPVHHTILPINIFDYRVVDFDFANDRVMLYDGAPKNVSGIKTTIIDYESVNDLIFVPVSINGVKGKALIDTGADISLVNRTFARRAGGKLNVLDQQLVQGSDMSSHQVEVYSFRRLRFGDSKISNFSIPSVNTPLFEALGFGDEPMLVMGMDLLSQYRVQVDRAEQQVHFAQRPQYRRPESNFLKTAF